MRCLNSILFAVGFTAFLSPGPILAQTIDRVYPASQKYSLDVSQEEARVKGTFTLDFETDVKGKEKTDFPVKFTVPVWFPETNPDDPIVTAFWRVFQKDALNRITPANQEIFEKAVGLRVTIGSELQPWTSFYAFTKGNTNEWAPLYWQEPGFACLTFVYTQPPDLVALKTPVSVSFRQSNLVEEGKKRFFFLPELENLPADKSTANFDQYSLKLTSGTNSTLDVVFGPKQFVVTPGKSVVLTPKRQQPLRAQVKRPGIPSLKAPR